LEKGKQINIAKPGRKRVSAAPVVWPGNRASLRKPPIDCRCLDWWPNSAAKRREGVPGCNT